MNEKSKRPIVIARRKRAPIRSAAAIILAGGIYLAYKAVQDWLNPRIPVQYNKAKLSTIKKIVPQVNYPFYTTIEEKLDPKEQAISMGGAMTGVTTSATMLPHYKNIINVFTNNDVRAIHNMFLKYVDQTESLYDWINSEWATSGTEESLRDKALAKLDSAGVGKTNVIKIPVNQMLLI